MKETLLIVLALLLFTCTPEKNLDGDLILKNTIRKHDSMNNWNETRLKLHIQEPRISNPHRYSILELDNSANSFKLQRNRDEHVSTHIIDRNGISSVLLDGHAEIDSLLIDKYRLDAKRNIGYKNFYHLLYGLPMTLDESAKEIIKTTVQNFKGEPCYKLELELKEAVISKYWNLFVSKTTMESRGIEIVVPDKEDGGERIYFDELIVVNGIQIPRIRHWHELKNDHYSGSDLIIKEIE